MVLSDLLLLRPMSGASFPKKTRPALDERFDAIAFALASMLFVI